MVGWKPPHVGWFKLNTNEACKGSAYVAGGGGVLHDSSGNWCLGFAGNIGICQVLGAEIWAIYKDLCLAWEAGIRRLVVEINSITTQKILTSGITTL